MPNLTPNLKLVKPLQTENYDVDIFNNNMDIVEAYRNSMDDDLYKDKPLTQLTTSNVITSLTSSKNGMLNVNSIQGKTMYKKADGTLTDTWESGVSLLSVSESPKLYTTTDVPINNSSTVSITFKNIYDYKVGDYIQWRYSNGNLYKDKILIINISGNTATLDFGTSITATVGTSEYFVKSDYKIEILSQGKNLFNKKNVIDGYNVRLSDGIVQANTSFCVSDFIQVKPNTNYTLKDGDRAYAQYDINKNYVTTTTASGTDLLFSFTTSSNCRYVKLSVPLVNKDIAQLEEGTIATTYEPFEGDKTEILTSQPLRQWDSIYSNGVVNRGSTQIILNGNEGWNMDNTGLPSGNSLLFYANIGNVLTVNNINIFSDKFKTKPVYGVDEEAIYNSSTYIWIRINKLKLSSQDVAGLKTWLSSNPVTVVYQLATPTTENTNKTLNLTAYENGSLVVNTGSINPTLTLEYPNNTKNGLSSTSDALGNIRENLEKWIATRNDVALLSTLVGQVVETNIKIAQLQNVNSTLITELTNSKIEILNLKTKLGGA